MADALKAFKEQEIDRYWAQVLVDEYVDVKKMKNDLRQILGEEPAINLEYVQETMLNEDSGELIKIEKLGSISFYYTYEKGIDERGNTIYGFDQKRYNVD